MSHKATNWFSDIDASELTDIDFRVLFFLCDAHNKDEEPEFACFPSQERLLSETGKSNGGLNNSLNRLEEKGFIVRRRSTAKGSSKRRTYYILGCDLDTNTGLTPFQSIANSILVELHMNQ